MILQSDNNSNNTITVLIMLIITISSAIASWLRVVPGGFWLLGNGFGWFAVLVVTVETTICFLSNGFVCFSKIRSCSN